MESIKNSNIPLFYETSSTAKSLCALGDCLEVMRDIPDGSVDLVLTDLPYGTTACKWDSVIDPVALWKTYRRVLTQTGTVVMTSAQPFTTIIMRDALDLFKHASVWVKNRPTGPQHAKNRPMSKHEDVLVFSKGKMGHVSQLGVNRMTYNPQGVESAGAKVVTEKGSHSRLTGPRPNQVGRVYEAQTGFPHTVLTFSKEESHVHPTQKPVDLMAYLVRTYSNEGDLVLDNCMGSGSTGVACANTNRNFVGIEQDPNYFKIATDRIQSAFDASSTNPYVD